MRETSGFWGTRFRIARRGNDSFWLVSGNEKWVFSGVFQAWNGVFGDSFLVLFFLGGTSGGVGGDAAGFSWGEVSRGGSGAAMGRWQFGGRNKAIMIIGNSRSYRSYRNDAQPLQPLEVPAVVGENCQVMSNCGRSDEQIKITDMTPRCSQSPSFLGKDAANGFIYCQRRDWTKETSQFPLALLRFTRPKYPIVQFGHRNDTDPHAVRGQFLKTTDRRINIPKVVYSPIRVHKILHGAIRPGVRGNRQCGLGRVLASILPHLPSRPSRLQRLSVSLLCRWPTFLLCP